MSRARRVVLLAILFLSLLVVTHRFWLTGAARLLVHDVAPVKSDTIVVLAGDGRGNRIVKAAELVKAGFAPVALISGPMPIYGVNEADLAIAYAVKRGYDASVLEPAYIKAFSTEEEAHAFKALLAGRGARRVLLVTSNFHTARATRTFRRIVGPGVEIVPVAAPDPYFVPESWWKDREGQKTFFFEAAKTVAAAVGL